MTMCTITIGLLVSPKCRYGFVTYETEQEAAYVCARVSHTHQSEYYDVQLLM